MIKKVKKPKKDTLSESEVRYRRLFETAHDGILILDSETGQITDVNPYLMQLLGYTKDEFLDKKLWEVGAFRNMRASRDAFRTIQKEGFIRYEDLPLETKGGELIDVEFVSNSYIAAGKVVIQCNIRNITERKKIETLKETRILLEAEQLKVRSIADATHELRTPLAVIKGNVDLFLNKKGKSGKSANRTLRAIDYEIKHLSSILSDLSLVTSKSWEMKGRVSYTQINLREFISNVVKRAVIFARQKKITITAKKIPEIFIVGDEMYLEKMLMNLLRNSIIYGRIGGHTTIDIKKTKTAITINVTDNGMGISTIDLPHVFERFYRGEKFRRADDNNIGLGLAIVRWVADMHGGTVTAKSIEGRGSVFSVTLPIRPSSAPLL